MSSTKATLDDLRIDRRAHSSAGRKMWIVVGILVVVLSLIGSAAWWFHRLAAL